MRFFLGVIAVLCFQVALAVPPKPDPKMTPGEMCDTTDPDYANPRYAQKIAWCQRNVSRAERDGIYDNYQIPKNCRGNYTIDHFIPLSVGGNNSARNLWPEHKKIKALRLNLETQIHEAMEQGTITQDEAINTVVQAKINPPKQAYMIQDPCEVDPAKTNH